MKNKILKLWLIAFLAFGPLPSSAQMSMMGAGVTQRSGSAPPAYTGPLDIQTGAAYAYGLRALSSAMRGHAIINACNSTGGVDVACADLNADTSTGNLVSATIGGITCPGTNCTIKIYYDQSGNGRNATQATVASRATLQAACSPSGTLACATPSGADAAYTATAISISQPLSFSSVIFVNNVTTTEVLIGADDATTTYDYTVLFPNGGAPRAQISTTNGSAVTNAITLNVWAVRQDLQNGNSSIVNFNGSNLSTFSTIPGTDHIAATDTIRLGDDGYSAGDEFTGPYEETIIFAADASANFTALCHNQFTYWGTPTSC